MHGFKNWIGQRIGKGVGFWFNPIFDRFFSTFLGVEDCFFGPRGITSLVTHATSIYY